MVLIFKSLIDNLTKFNILTGERKRGESWALENVLTPIPVSQEKAVTFLATEPIKKNGVYTQALIYT